jgi:hypothetical protein
MPIPFAVRVAFLVLFCVTSIGGALLIYHEPLPQPLSYHNFADQRPLLGIPHALNVISNFPFVVVGVWGLFFMARHLVAGLAAFFILLMLERRQALVPMANRAAPAD